MTREPVDPIWRDMYSLEIAYRDGLRDRLVAASHIANKSHPTAWTLGDIAAEMIEHTKELERQLAQMKAERVAAELAIVTKQTPEPPVGSIVRSTGDRVYRRVWKDMHVDGNWVYMRTEKGVSGSPKEQFDLLPWTWEKLTQVGVTIIWTAG